MPATQLDSNNFQPNSGVGSPTISSIQVTNSSYTVLDDTAVSTSGGFIKITGTKFNSGVQVYIGTTLATSISLVNSTVLNVQVPATAAGSYDVTVVNTDGTYGLKPIGITFSPINITWVTSSSLGTYATGVAISLQLNATGATGYQLQSGSTLPTGLTLSSSGLLSGTVNVVSDTTYSFTIEAYDSELQDAPRTFSLSVVLAIPPTSIDYLVVAGGASGGGTSGPTSGGHYNGGGGGAGGMRSGSLSISSGVTYTVTVGGGGASVTSGNGNSGSNSIFSTITSTGGGRGGQFGAAGGSGGSGGGSGRDITGAGGAGISGQGNNGGSNPGGGGGASAAGGNGSSCIGGNGSSSSITGSSVVYAGGGGGADTGAGTEGNGVWRGGTGGGGFGKNSFEYPGPGGAGSVNTGGGGGASGVGFATGAGGSGVVIIRYSDSFGEAVSTTGSPTYTVTGGFRIYRFTGSGSITF
jgi:hypothetical protein